MVCSELLRDISQAEAGWRAPERVQEWCHQFRERPGCHRVYWEGSHYRRMKDWIEALVATAEVSGDRNH